MRVCIVGCGAVGSLFAANLASLEDVEVWAYDLAQAHVDAINERGLRLTGAGEVHATGIRATADAADVRGDRLLVADAVLDRRDGALREGVRGRGDRRLRVHRLRRDDAEVTRGQGCRVARRLQMRVDVTSAREP